MEVKHLTHNDCKDCDTEDVTSLIHNHDTNGALSSGRFLPSYRLLVAVLGSCSLVTTLASQTSMSSAFICMIERETSSLTNSTNTSSFEQFMSPKPNASNGYHFNHDVVFDTHPRRENGSEWKFDWNSDEQSLTLSLFFFAYYVMQIPAGMIPTWFGIKKTLVWTQFLIGVTQALTVPAALMGLHWLYSIRFITGILNGPIYATAFALGANWAPRLEISVMFGIIGIGVEIGNSFSFAVSSFACSIDFQGGWPIIFYTVAAWSMLSAFVSLVCLSDWPSTNRFISSQEKLYIMERTDHRPKSDSGAFVKRTVPFRQILTSKPVWAIMMAQVATEWAYYSLVTEEPVYLTDILKLTATEASLTCGLPFLFIIIVVNLASVLSDHLITNRLCSRTNVRKINECVALLLPAIGIMSLGYLPTHSMPAAFIMNTIICCGLGFTYPGYVSNIADLSPAHTGLLTAMSQVAAVWVSFVIPMVFNVIIKENTREEWQIPFYMTSALQVLVLVFYVICASGELQPWATGTETNNDVIIESHPNQNQDSSNSCTLFQDDLSSGPKSKTSQMNVIDDKTPLLHMESIS